MRPRTCEHRMRRLPRARGWWDAVRRGHITHVCGRVLFGGRHEHIGKHVCGCGVKWA